MKKTGVLLLILSTANMIHSQTKPTTTNTTTQPTPVQANTNNTKQSPMDKWTETMQYGISQQRVAVVKQIRMEKLTNAIPLLQDSYSKDDNNTVKEEIIYTLIDLNFTQPAFWSSIFTSEKDMILLQRAAFAVEKMSIPIGKEVFNKLSACVTNGEAFRFNSAAVRALGEIKYKDAIPTITELATNQTNNQDLRGASVVALGMYEDASLIPLMQGFLTNSIEPRLIRRYAALGIGRTKSPEAVNILSPVAIDEKEEQTVRLNAISGLSYISTPEVITTMENLTKSDNTAIRTEAIKSLGKTKAKSAQKILEYKAANDPEGLVRKAASAALNDITNSNVK